MVNIMCSRNQLDEIISKVVAFSREHFGDKFCHVILYGSYARGDYDDESDIDIMILVDMMPEELVKHRRIFNDFTTDIDLNYNVVLSSKLQSKQFFNEWKNTLTFYQNVIKDGVIYA